MSTSDESNKNNDTVRDLTGYEVVVGIAGGIAAYKVCSVVSGLVQRGVGTTCVMTEAATHFVTPLTFQTLSGREVVTSIWGQEESYYPDHIGLNERADLILIAPATANIIAKIAHGIADDMLSTVMAGVTCPVLIAPAMNCNMWSNPVVQENVAKLRELGFHFVGPGQGWLACRAVGAGRMEEPAIILDTVANLLKTDPPKSTTLS